MTRYRSVRTLALALALAASPRATTDAWAQQPERDSAARPAASEKPQERVLNNAPEWFFNVPTDTAFVLMAATATSEDLQVALDKARMQARVNIAEQLESRIEALGKRFVTEAGGRGGSQLTAQYELTAKNVVTRVLVGSRVREQQWYTEGKLFRVYVLLELPMAESKRELVAEVKSSKSMYTRFRASKAFKDLEREVAKLSVGGT